MQPASESHQPNASAEERLAEQVRETRQLREQLARASVKEGPILPPLSVPELNKETSGCPTLWGKNIANCSKNPQFLLVMCVLYPCCAHTPPKKSSASAMPQQLAYPRLPSSSVAHITPIMPLSAY